MAYIQHTFGSARLSKGVLVQHDNLMSMADFPGIQPADRLFAITTVSFDIAVSASAM